MAFYLGWNWHTHYWPGLPISSWFCGWHKASSAYWLKGFYLKYFSLLLLSARTTFVWTTLSFILEKCESIEQRNALLKYGTPVKHTIVHNNTTRKNLAFVCLKLWAPDRLTAVKKEFRHLSKLVYIEPSVSSWMASLNVL